MMDKLESLSHTAWNWKCHVVVIPKRRRRTLYAKLRQHLGEVFRKLASQKERRVEEGHLMAHRVHAMLATPPKCAVSQVVEFIKGKSAIHLARVYGERKRNFVGQQLWAREYIKNQRKGGLAVGPTRPLEMTGHRSGGTSKDGPR